MSKLSVSGFARAFRLRDDDFLFRLLCMWDRDGVRAAHARRAQRTSARARRRD